MPPEGEVAAAATTRDVSLAVVASALAVAAGASVADPLIGLGVTLVILKITRDSWITVRGSGEA